MDFTVCDRRLRPWSSSHARTFELTPNAANKVSTVARTSSQLNRRVSPASASLFPASLNMYETVSLCAIFPGASAKGPRAILSASSGAIISEIRGVISSRCSHASYLLPLLSSRSSVSLEMSSHVAASTRVLGMRIGIRRFDAGNVFLWHAKPRLFLTHNASRPSLAQKRSSYSTVKSCTWRLNRLAQKYDA